MIGTMEDKSVGRKKSTRVSRTVRIDEDVYDDANIVAAYQKKDLGRYLSDVLRPLVKEELLRHARETSGAKPPKGKGKRDDAGAE